MIDSGIGFWNTSLCAGVDVYGVQHWTGYMTSMKYSLQGLSNACWKLSRLLARCAATPNPPDLPLWMLILSGGRGGKAGGCCCWEMLVNPLDELTLEECLRREG